MSNERPAGLDWFKSSYSDQEGGECVEVAAGASAVHVRDSKAVSGPQLRLTSGTWTAFARFASDRQL